LADALQHVLAGENAGRVLTLLARAAEAVVRGTVPPWVGRSIGELAAADPLEETPNKADPPRCATACSLAPHAEPLNHGSSHLENILPGAARK
jgi:hypothetical protein